MTTLEVHRYQTADGKEPLTEWLDRLRDGRTRARIVARLDRLQIGLFGDAKSVGAGVSELRYDFGPGYRVYYGQEGAQLVLLLCGGDKGSQTTDIEKAHDYWKDYKARSAPNPPAAAKPPVQGFRAPAKRK
ncbi:MAG: type II toxin-antitoxin system RelE/ParE family toxin [Steroidobacteraceae bacterium]